MGTRKSGHSDGIFHWWRPQCAQNPVWTLPQNYLHSDPKPQILQLPDLRPQDAELTQKHPKAYWARNVHLPCCGEQFLPIGQMPDIAAMPVGRKHYRSAKRRDTLQLTIFVTCQISCFSLRNLIKIVKFLTHAYFYKVKWYFPFWEVPNTVTLKFLAPKSSKWEFGLRGWNQVTLSVTWF
mgnify:CR=1 FL=1